MAPPWPLLERDGEVALLDELVAAHGERGSVIVVEAAAGLGKTTLLAAAHDRALAAGVEVRLARATPLDVHAPWAIVRQCFEGDGAEVDEALAGVGAADEVDLHSTDTALTLLVRAFSRWSRQHGGLLLVDDLHWCDEESLRFLTSIAGRVQAGRGGLVVATRPDGRVAVRQTLAALLAGARARRIVLGPLTSDGAAQLLRDRLGAVHHDALRTMQQATEGNPLLLDLLADAVLRVPAADRPTAPDAVARIAANAVPRSMISRMAAAGDDAGRLAEAVAILGDGARLGDVAQLAELSPDVAADCADRLTDAGLLARDTTLRFVHALVRDAVYGTLSGSDRDRGHLRAARVLLEGGTSQVQAASHLMDVRPRSDAAVVDALRRAAREALEIGGVPTAIQYLQRALEEPAAPEVRGAVLFELGVAEASDARAGAIEHLRDALRAAGDDAERAATLRALMLAYTTQGRSGEAAQIALADPLLAAGRPPIPAIETELLVLGETDLVARRLVRDRLERLVHLPFDDTLPDHRRALVLCALEGFGTDARAEDVLDQVTRGWAGGELLRGEPPTSSLGTMAMAMAAHAGDLALSERIADAAMAAAERHGSGYAVAAVLAWRAHLRFAQGDLQAARADAEEVLGLEHHEASIAAAVAASAMVDVLLEVGELELAASIAAEHSADADADVAVLLQPLIDRRARILVARGEPRAALDLTVRCEAFARGWGMRNPTVMVWREPAQQAARVLGDLARARELADEALADAIAFGAPHKIGRARMLRSVELDGATAIAELDQARLELDGAPLWHAHAGAQLGPRLASAGREAAARDVLLGALDVADRCGARVLVGQVRQVLRTLGARPRRTARSGVEALTPSERRVAELAAGDATNAEIAARLVISVKTVEMHLGGTFRKLGVSRRQELAAALWPTGP